MAGRSESFIVGRRRLHDHHLPQHVYPHHGRYRYLDGSGKYHDLGKVWDAEAKKKWVALSEEPESFGSFNWWFDAFMDRRKQLVQLKKLSERTYEDNEKEAEYLKAAFGQKASPVDVIPADVIDYLAFRGQTAWVRANRERALLSSFYTWLLGKRDSGVTVNPCIGVKRNSEKRRERVIEDWEYAKVYKRAQAAKRSKAVHRMMALIYGTLQRPEDLVAATPRHNLRTIQHEGRDVRVLRVVQLKTGAALDIILAPELDALLKECMGPVVYPDRPFISKRNGKAFTYDGLSAMFRRHVKACDIADFGLYDLRGKGATDMYRAGVSKERIQQLLGHDSVTTTEIYLKARMPNVVMPNERRVGNIPEPNGEKAAETG